MAAIEEEHQREGIDPRTDNATVAERAKLPEDTTGLCLERTNHEPPHVCHRLHGHIGWCSDPRSGVTWGPELRAGVQRVDYPKSKGMTTEKIREAFEACRGLLSPEAKPLRGSEELLK